MKLISDRGPAKAPESLSRNGSNLTKYVPARDSFCIAITESTQGGEARRAATSLAHAVGFDEVLSGQVAIVVTELANNIVRHARSGEIVLRSVSDASDQKAT